MTRIKKSQVDRLASAELRFAEARTQARRAFGMDPALQGILISLTEGMHEMAKVLVEVVAPKGYFAEEAE